LKVGFVNYLALTLLLLSCNHSQVSGDLRKVASLDRIQPPVEQGEIWGETEKAMMDEIALIFKQTLIESTGDSQTMRRDAHPKHHGCVASELIIDNTLLPKKYQVGLFKENKKYQSIVRFSNGDPDFTKADAEKDVRGMAVKIINVPYSSYLQDIGAEEYKSVHDLVFMNADAFFIPNPGAYEKFMQSTKGRFGVLSYLLLHWGTLKNILKARVQISHPLDIDYASATPYKLGASSMKMKFVSCKQTRDSIPKNPGENFLGEKLASYLAREEGCYDFYVQPNQEPKKNYIEDAMIEWDSQKSPFIKVGRMTIKKQTGFRKKERMKACEGMSFNPWRAPVENRPLGGVNRIRLKVYLDQFKLRQEYNRKN
jgi:hypothetical protein